MSTGGLIYPADYKDNDQTHPDESVFKKMAAVWAAAIAKAEAAGIIPAPIDIGRPYDGDASCMPKVNQFNGPHQTQHGSGWEDGTWIHSQQAMGTVIERLYIAPKANTASIAKQFHLAQFVNGGGAEREGATEDLIMVLDEVGYMSLLVNVNFHGVWQDFDAGYPCPNRGVRWGDVSLHLSLAQV